MGGRVWDCPPRGPIQAPGRGARGSSVTGSSSSDWSFIASPEDTLSLWHLLPVVDGPDRERIYDRIIELDTQLVHDRAFTRTEVLALDDRAMGALMSEIKFLWFAPR